MCHPCVHHIDQVLSNIMASRLVIAALLVLVPTLVLAKRECPATGYKTLQTQGKCYSFIKALGYRFERASIFCQEGLGSLAVIKSKAENDAIAAYLNSTIPYETDKYKRAYHWIGLEYLPEKGRFMWVDGTEMTYNNFRRQRGPNSHPVARVCVVTDPEGVWYEYNCRVLSFFGVRFICENSLPNQ